MTDWSAIVTRCGVCHQMGPQAHTGFYGDHETTFVPGAVWCEGGHEARLMATSVCSERCRLRFTSAGGVTERRMSALELARWERRHAGSPGDKSDSKTDRRGSIPRPGAKRSAA